MYSLIHIILMFFIRSGNHKFYIQFLRLLELQSFIIILYIKINIKGELKSDGTTFEEQILCSFGYSI
jgi:hypothetical protein